MAKDKLLEQNVLDLLEGKKYKDLKNFFSTMNPVDIAELLEDFSEKNFLLLFRILPKDLAADTFVEMNNEQKEMLIRSFSDRELREVVNELYIDDMVDIVEEMPANVVNRILMNTDAKTRMLVNELLKYPEDSAGSIMTTEFISLNAEMTIADAIKRIREKGFDSETIDTCYVTDNVRHLIGFVTIRTIILSDENLKIQDVMERGIISVGTLEDQETVANLFEKYDLTVLPVVDNDTRLVGIVTVDDAIDVLRKEATEDIEKMAAITPTDKPYLKKTTFEIWKSRIPWLLALMISATFTGMIITSFEDTLKTYVLLTAYIPMLMGTGGNSGSQSSVTIIRSLSLSEIEFGDIFRVLWKEFRIAIMCGLTLAVVNFAKLIAFDHTGVYIALTVSLTLVVTISVAKLVGCSLPMLAEKVGFDPAVMASPFITTIVDTISLIIYFNIAGLVLGF
ncbi:MAG: magnesium transporter [Clostridiaceae bacterium]|nr:magnesium transporter [Clostridiaceae bacterium]